jgi:hypothetical protein
VPVLSTTKLKFRVRATWPALPPAMLPDAAATQPEFPSSSGPPALAVGGACSGFACRSAPGTSRSRKRKQSALPAVLPVSTYSSWGGASNQGSQITIGASLPLTPPTSVDDDPASAILVDPLLTLTPLLNRSPPLTPVAEWPLPTNKPPVAVDPLTPACTASADRILMLPDDTDPEPESTLTMPPTLGGDVVDPLSKSRPPSGASAPVPSPSPAPSDVDPDDPNEVSPPRLRRTSADVDPLPTLTPLLNRSPPLKPVAEWPLLTIKPPGTVDPALPDWRIKIPPDDKSV